TVNSCTRVLSFGSVPAGPACPHRQVDWSSLASAARPNARTAGDGEGCHSLDQKPCVSAGSAWNLPTPAPDTPGCPTWAALLSWQSRSSLHASTGTNVGSSHISATSCLASA